MTSSPFTTEVDSVRSGGSAEDSSGRLLSLLSDSEKLWLLDGDHRFWPGVLDWALHGYNHAPIVAGAVPRLGIPGLRFTDGPRGVSMGRSTCFPVAMARGATWDPALEERVGLAIGLEARAQGANFFGGVCVNLLRHPAWGRAQETFGEDPVHVGAMGAALVRGVQRNTMACVKHFALNSMENARFQVDVSASDEDLHEIYLAQFRSIVEAGVCGVMSAYNLVNGSWCGHSSTLLTEILRGEWGFAGPVVSDFVWGLRDPVGSLEAGLDVELPFRQQRAHALPTALATGALDREVVDRAARRVLATQVRGAAMIAEAEPEPSVVGCGPHRALAREVAARSMVLLRNESVEGVPVLPLDVRSTRTVAVIGRLATQANLGDRGSSSVRPPTTSSPLDGLQGVVRTLYDDGSDPRRAAAVAAQSDAAIVVVGYRDVDEGEFLLPNDEDSFGLMPWPLSVRRVAQGTHRLAAWLDRRGLTWGGDRGDLGLPPADVELIRAVSAANPRTIAVVIAGSAVLMEGWRAQVPAIVLAWYPGMEGGRALAEVLMGEREPGGRLPFAVPRAWEHLPFFDRRARSVRYDRWFGYRKLDRDGNQPAFPYGFGLGYTTWLISGLEVWETRAEVTVTNTGERAGRTVVQLYAVDGRSRDRPGRQLVGFAGVELAAGASTRLPICWSLRPISIRDSATRRWSVRPGDYLFEAGQHLGDPAAATARLEVR